MKTRSLICAVILCALACSEAGADTELWARARGRTENGEFSAALLLWQELAAQHPSSPEPWIYHSLAARRSEDFQRATISASRALEIEPGNAAALWQRALSYSLRQDFDAAIADFEQVETPRNMATFHHQYAVALQAVGRVEEAREQYGIAVRLNPELFPSRYAYYLLLRGHESSAAAEQLAVVQRLRAELPDWIRNDQLRLERGELSEMKWPGSYDTLATKRRGHLLSITLEPVHGGADVEKTAIEVWTHEGVTRRAYSGTPTLISVGKADRIDVLRIVWPHGGVQNLFDVDAQQPEIAVREKLFIKGSWGGVRVE
jgi:tetratricopeptide (TPR) repeat protein